MSWTCNILCIPLWGLSACTGRAYIVVELRETRQEKVIREPSKRATRCALNMSESSGTCNCILVREPDQFEQSSQSFDERLGPTCTLGDSDGLFWILSESDPFSKVQCQGCTRESGTQCTTSEQFRWESWSHVGRSTSARTFPGPATERICSFLFVFWESQPIHVLDTNFGRNWIVVDIHIDAVRTSCWGVDWSCWWYLGRINGRLRRRCGIHRNLGKWTATLLLLICSVNLIPEIVPHH